jgi:hypothetical protein
VKHFSSKRRWIAAAIILLLLFLIRPGVSRLKSRIIVSISSGVGRSVDIGSVHFRLLPRPGFDLENLVVYDDLAFGAEPMLRASQVTAWLRLTSLAHGRLEIARLDLTEPSLNLVHGQDGRWNLEALLERAARTPLAPTAKAKSEPRPAFPYIEATSARINFKNGPEKKPFALTNADFSLWQDSENAWGLRLQAQPMRTDLNLNDTGVLRINGTWQRATALRDTPLQFTLEWSRAQLGQLTKLLTGNDQGWRGGVQLDATLAGTPPKLHVSSNASIQDFRRYDLTGSQALRLAARCDAQYSSLDHAFHEVACSAPTGSGSITLKGNLGLPGSHNYRVAVAAENVEASAMLALAERAKKNLPTDLTADGTLSGSLAIVEDAGSPLRFEGKGEIAGFHLVSTASKSEMGPETVPFVLTNGDDSNKRPKRPGSRNATVLRPPAGPHLEFGPFPLRAGRGGDPIARGWANRSGYGVLVAGDTDIAQTLRLAHMFGIPAPQAAADGAAEIDLKIAGSWAPWGKDSTAGFPGPQVTGTAKLRNVRVALRGAGGPVEILSADMQLFSDLVRVGKLNAKAAGAAWTGSLALPRGCGTLSACQIGFNLNSSEIRLSELSQWISPRPKPRPWYRVLQSNPQPSWLVAGLRAAGRITAERLLVQRVGATHVSANVTLEAGTVQISELNADLFGATHRGQWRADFSAQPAICSGSGRLSGIPLARLADSMQDAWITGLATASYQLQGPCPGFWESAEGTMQFDVTDATLPHISLAGDEGPLKVARLKGEARLHGGEFTMQDATLDSPSGRFQLSGTASLARELNLKLGRAAGGATAGYRITGPLAAPQVAPLPGTEQARLKP